MNDKQPIFIMHKGMSRCYFRNHSLGGETTDVERECHKFSDKQFQIRVQAHTLHYESVEELWMWLQYYSCKQRVWSPSKRTDNYGFAKKYWGVIPYYYRSLKHVEEKKRKLQAEWGKMRKLPDFRNEFEEIWRKEYIR